MRDAMEHAIAAWNRVPEVLLLFRHRAGISMQDAARRAGVSVTRWCAYETRETVIEAEELRRAAEAIGTTIADLARYARTLLMVETFMGDASQAEEPSEWAARLLRLSEQHRELTREISQSIEQALSRLAIERHHELLDETKREG